MDNSEPIRVLNLFTIMNRGGAETMVMNYYRKIDRTKVQFDFMVHRQERGAYDGEIEALGGKIYRMPPLRFKNIPEYKKLLKEFFTQHQEYRIIHAHMSERAYYIFKAAKKAGVPVRICHAHNRPYGVSIKMLKGEWLKYRIRPYVTHMFVCGEEAGKWLFGQKKAQSFIMLNNAIDAERFAYNPEKADKLRKTMNYKDKVVIGHVGRFNEQKNHPFLVDIFACIHEKNQNTRLMLVGDDSNESGQKIHAKVDSLGLTESVDFLGVRSDVPELYQVMDTFLFPSLFEGLSVASIEAQAAGLPVFISEGVPIECKKTDLVQVTSLEEKPDVWADKILAEIEKPRKNYLQQIRDAGFDIEENARRLEHFYVLVNENRAVNTL